MFTLEKIENLHSKVKSWSDFPLYIKNLKDVWVISYDVFVNDWHSEYFWENNYKLFSDSAYQPLKVSDKISKEMFLDRLKLHQNWWSDYMTFCLDVANCWINRWRMDLLNMTCTYFDKSWSVVLVESIPSVG